MAEDDAAVSYTLSRYLRSLQYDVVEVASCHGIKELFRTSCPDAAILDYSLPDGNALEILPLLKQSHPSVPIILLTGNGTIELAVQAIKEGADQFLTKPVQLSAIAVLLDRMLQNQRVQQKQMAQKIREGRELTNPFLGNSPAIRELQEQVERIQRSQCPLLITGETGTGKGVLARWIHAHSLRAEEPFVDLNCAGFGRELLETELFGHEAGAFTGAVQRKVGLLEVAQGGTAFLDEIGDMDIQVQPKLLKILEERRFRRLGDVRERQLDIRLIAASHQDLGQLVQEKKFRSDLYFRVSTVVLRMPSLRERMEDIPVLARFFFRRAALEIGRPNLKLTAPLEEKLAGYRWPGNVRELKNAMERAALLATGDAVRIHDLHLEFDGRAVQPGAEEGGGELHTLSEMEDIHIRRMLAAEKGNIARAAVRLGIARSSLYNKIKVYGIDCLNRPTGDATRAGQVSSPPPAVNAPSSPQGHTPATVLQ